MSATVTLEFRWRGETYKLELPANASLADVAPVLASAVGGAQATLRLLGKGGTKPLQGDAASSTFVNELRGPLLLLGSTTGELAVEAACATAATVTAKAQRLPSARHEEERELARSSGSAEAPATSSVFFGRFECFSYPAAVQPPPAAALRLLHSLAADPGISKIMKVRGWRVGKLSEMPPEGKVGVSAVCVLGYNVNAGQEISLRLRTDDLRGLRPYARVRETLIHELAHMTYSEHDLRFKQLNSQLTREARDADWRRSDARTVGEGTSAPSRREPVASLLLERGHTLGSAATAPSDVRAAAAAAALAREAERAMAAEAEAALTYDDIAPPALGASGESLRPC